MNLVKLQNTKFLYTNNKKIREIKETILFTIASQRIKYLVINLPTETKDLYAENYKKKKKMKTIRKMTQMERYSMFLDGKINIVKMTILPEAIYRFNVTPIKLPLAFFTELEQKIFYSVYANTKDLE